MQQQEMEFMKTHLNLRPRHYAGAALWVREFRFYSEKQSLTPVRSIQLSSGLNIIWGDPSEDQDEDLIGSGHAAGKSLFCRFLRYALGEDKFGNSEEQAAIRAQFPDPYILVEVMIKGETWLVKRPLEPGGGHQCSTMSMAEYDGRTERITWKPYHVFTEQLEALTLSELGDERELIGFDEDITWLKLLAWLSRDQECRLNHLANWRESKTVDRVIDYSNAIIRTALKFNNSELSATTKRCDQLKEKQNQREKELERAKINLSFLESHLNNLIKNSSTDEVRHYQTWGDLSLADLEGKVRDKSTLYQEAIRTAKDALDERYKKAFEALYKEDLADDALLSKSQEEIDFIQLEIGRAKDASNLSVMGRERPAAPFRCNTPLIQAIANDCKCRSSFCRQLNIDEDISVEKAAELIRKHGEESIQKEETKIINIKARRSKRKNQTNKLEDARQAELAQINQTARSQREEIEELREINKELSKIQLLRRTRDHLEEEISKKRAELTRLHDQCDQLRNQSPESKLIFQTLFYDLLRNTINPKYQCELKMEKHRIRINLLKHNSEAMKVASILVFDCASLLYSLTQPSALPGFLIHDSPREADLSGGIFNKILSCLPDTLNEYINDKVMPYQYIVTTTTKPSDKLMPYLRATLRANKPQERLLKCDF